MPWRVGLLARCSPHVGSQGAGHEQVVDEVCSGADSGARRGRQRAGGVLVFADAIYCDWVDASVFGRVREDGARGAVAAGFA